ncbi:MAG TPA: hypothetical protein VK208_23365, partial [Pyrinomonadaceae bacterium]|nr:hypothetical protein [Pyrinomonadaceae bacterium]
ISGCCLKRSIPNPSPYPGPTPEQCFSPNLGGRKPGKLSASAGLWASRLGNEDNSSVLLRAL